MLLRPRLTRQGEIPGGDWRVFDRDLQRLWGDGFSTGWRRSSRRSERAYRRGDALMKRRELMEARATLLMGGAEANVVAIRAAE